MIEGYDKELVGSTEHDKESVWEKGSAEINTQNFEGLVSDLGEGEVSNREESFGEEEKEDLLSIVNESPEISGEVNGKGDEHVIEMLEGLELDGEGNAEASKENHVIPDQNMDHLPKPVSPEQNPVVSTAYYSPKNYPQCSEVVTCGQSLIEGDGATTDCSNSLSFAIPLQGSETGGEVSDNELEFPPGFTPSREDMLVIKELMKEGVSKVPFEHQKGFIESVDNAEDGELFTFFKEKFSNTSNGDTNFVNHRNLRRSPRLKKRPKKLADTFSPGGLKKGFLK